MNLKSIIYILIGSAAIYCIGYIGIITYMLSFKSASKKEKKLAFDTSHFDTSLIDKAKKYEALNVFLSYYKDTIFAHEIKFRPTKSINITTGKETLENEDCLTFNEYGFHNFHSLPDFLKPQFDSLYAQIGKKKLLGFTICKQKGVNIDIKTEIKGNGLFVCHRLIWDKENKGDYTVIKQKDTIINEKYIYRIEMYEIVGAN